MRYDMSSAANMATDKWIHDIIFDDKEDNKKYYLYLFEKGEEEEAEENLQGVFKTEEECMNKAEEIAKRLGYSPYYWRAWIEKGGTVYDFGSWTKFFKVSKK